MQKTTALIVTTREHSDINKNHTFTGLVNSGSKETLINYIPERNEPMRGEQRMTAASILGSRAQMSY